MYFETGLRVGFDHGVHGVEFAELGAALLEMRNADLRASAFDRFRPSSAKSAPDSP